MVGISWAALRVIRSLGFPHNDAVFHVDIPGTGPRAVHTMGGTNLFIVLPPLSVKVFPGSLAATNFSPVFGGFFLLTAVLFTFGAEKSQGG